VEAVSLPECAANARRWARRLGVFIVAAMAIATSAASVARADALVEYRADGDRIEAPLGGATGDAARGRALIVARDTANCVLCHAVPDPAIRFSGDVGPALDGVGARLTPAQIRLRIVDNSRRDPNTVMPSYYRIDGRQLVAAAWRDKPVLTVGQVEDLVAYLSSLR
jgi:sulfur-oxidizing protein SoxX